MRVTLGQPVTLSAGQALFFTVYRPEVNTATGVMYVNGSAYFEVVQSDMPEGWSTFVLTAPALAAKASGNTEVSFIDFRTNTAGVDWYYGGIFLVGPGESELPEDAVMLSQRASNISVPSAWGWSGNILTDAAAVNKEGEIWIYYKTTGSGSAYLSLNDYTDGTSRYSSTGIPLSSEWTLLKLKISEVTKPTGTGWGDYFTKNSVDTVEWTTMQVQMADSTSIFSCSWIAYVPPAA